MVEYLTQLSLFAIILIVGISVTYFSSKIKLPDVLLLLLVGLFFGYSKFITPDQIIPTGILTSLSIFALIMIVFVSTSNFKLEEVKQLSPYALKVSFIFLFACLLFLTLFTQLLFSENIFILKTFLLSLLFSALMAGTAPDIILSAVSNAKNKIIKILQFESILNTPLTVLIPLIIIDFYFEKFQAGIFLIKFLQQIMTGLGAGLLLGYISIFILKKIDSEEISPILIIALILGIYSISESISGNGILAITTFGLIFGRSQIRSKIKLQKFESLFTEFLRIIIFILIGATIILPLDITFLIKSIILFILYIIIRFLAINITFDKSKLKIKEKLFMAFNAPKGLATAVVIFTLNTFKLEAMTTILQLSLAFMLYSVLLSTIVIKFEDKFIKLKENQKTVLKRLKSNK
ncbi:MAG: cation:proton antiporter, partial [Nanoarchaeota archaeon]|nr:cation:proton antiporter [Nanoarchaeota archaeon]